MLELQYSFPENRFRQGYEQMK